MIVSSSRRRGSIGSVGIWKSENTVSCTDEGTRASSASSENGVGASSSGSDGVDVDQSQDRDREGIREWRK